MNNTNRIASAVGGLLLAPLALIGCASQDSFEEAIPGAVLAADPNITDTYLSFSSGPGGRGVALRIYVSDTSDAAIADSIEAALDAAFHASPSRPSGIILDVAKAPSPDDVNINVGRLPLDNVKPLLELPGTVINDRVTLSSDELDTAFGPWEKR